MPVAIKICFRSTIKIDFRKTRRKYL